MGRLSVRLLGFALASSPVLATEVQREGIDNSYQPSNRRSMFRLAGALVLAALVSGCQSIPDVSEWNKATKDVTAAVTEGFQASAGINGDIAKRLDKVLDAKPAYADPAKRYAAVEKAMRTRADDYEKLFGAIADYSAALAAIARAADNSAKTVDAVAGSVNGLLNVVGVVPLAGTTFTLLKELAAEAIKIKAASDFGDAVQKADGVIGPIANLLIADLADLKATVGPSKDVAIREAIEGPNARQLEYRAALERRRAELQAKIRVAVAPGPAAFGEKPPPTTSLLDVPEAPELAKVEQYLKEADSWFVPLKSELDKALSARAKSEELVTQTGRAVQAWRDSHASLALAVRERRLPDSGRLAAIGTRIRALVDEIKKEK